MIGDPLDHSCTGPDGKGPYRPHILEREQKIGTEVAFCRACWAAWQQKIGQPWTMTHPPRSTIAEAKTRRLNAIATAARRLGYRFDPARERVPDRGRRPGPPPLEGTPMLSSELVAHRIAVEEERIRAQRERALELNREREERRQREERRRRERR